MRKISVIIPSFNQSQYLSDCIESVLSQTKAPHEIIVIDDGSTDNSLEIARSYEDKGVKVIAQVNKGLASARNTGIMNSTGEYILPLDADDMLYENAIELIEKTIEETDADIVAPSLKNFGIDSTTIILEKVVGGVESFIEANRIPYASAFKKSCALEVGGYSPKMVHGYEDLHFWIDLLKRGKKIVTIQEPLLLYRTKESSMWHDALKHHDELMAQINKDHAPKQESSVNGR